MSKRFFVTGIGTGVGKTLISALLAEVYKADYFKPVQCGSLDYTDEDFVREHLFNSKSVVHPTQHVFRLGASPHAAAAAEGKNLSLESIHLPTTANTLLVEGAGGALVPLNNEREYMIDIAKKHGLELILVIDYYLGSINHTLLTLNYLKNHSLPISLLVFNGDKVDSTRRAILNEAGDVPFMEVERFEVNPGSLKDKADELRTALSQKLTLA